MQVLKTAVGHHLLNMFPENVAFHIASFLEEDKDESRAKQEYTTMVDSLYKATMKTKSLNSFGIARI